MGVAVAAGLQAREGKGSKQGGFLHDWTRLMVLLGLPKHAILQ